jgi:hypothetical protein
MGLMETGIKVAARRMPKKISPRTHSILDYAIAGSFFVTAGLLWRSHRRAAVAAVACGVAEVATAAITDYPGGVRPMITFATHEKVDGALASVAGVIPLVLRFSDDREANIFRAYGVAIAALTGLTDFEDEADEWVEAA